MSDSRTSGMILMAMAIAAFLGANSNWLPPATFFPALALFIIGAFKFMRSNHAVLEEAEQRAYRALHPEIRENRQAAAHAERQAARRGAAVGHPGAAEDAPQERSIDPRTGYARTEPIELEIEEDDFVVATDVSFPLEVQTGDALADQLHKLNQLVEQGVLTPEEYAVAKAKLLG